MTLDDGLQWAGAGFIIAGHGSNAAGPAAYPWNIMAFLIGTLLFLIWSLRVKNHPQLMVNCVAIAIGVVGLVRAAV